MAPGARTRQDDGMDDPLFLALDIGTTAVKAGLIDGRGALVARRAAPYPTARAPGGVAEQDPGDWLRLVDEALHAFAAEGHGPRIAAIGLASQVNTHVFADAGGRPLRPAILWQDTRAAKLAARLDAEVGARDRMAWWGAPMPIDASHVLARMAWVAAHEPEIWAATDKVLLPKDLCLRALTGETATDPVSNIGLVGPDLAHVDGPLGLVPGAAARRAPLRGVTEVAGRVRAGPLAGVPVVTGTMDAWAGIVGAGGAGDGVTVCLSGTSEVIGLASDTALPAPGAVVFPAAEGLRLHAAPTQAGGDSLAWHAEAAGMDVGRVARLAAATPPSEATPLFLPQLSGERAPYWNPDLRGAFLGLGRRTGAAEMARAVCEGVALSARDAMGAVRASSGREGGTLACAGGGFRTPALAQLRADVMGVPVRLLEAGEAGLLGAAMIAAVGVGAQPGLGAAHRAMVRLGAPIAPHPERAARYDALFALYRDAVAGLAPLTARLAAARAAG